MAKKKRSHWWLIVHKQSGIPGSTHIHSTRAIARATKKIWGYAGFEIIKVARPA